MGLPYGFIKLRKRSIFVIDSYLNGSAFTALRRDPKFLRKYVKGVPFVNRRYTKISILVMLLIIFDYYATVFIC